MIKKNKFIIIDQIYVQIKAIGRVLLFQQSAPTFFLASTLFLRKTICEIMFLAFTRYCFVVF